MVMIYYSPFFLQMYMYVTEIDESTVCMKTRNSSLPLVLSCGHPCLMCLQSQSIDTSIFASDHQYSKNISSRSNVATKSIGINTDESMFASYSTLNQQTFNNLVTSAPIKQQLHHSNEQNSTFDNSSFKDDSRDETFNFSSKSNSSDSYSTHDIEDKNVFEENIVSQRKFIVFRPAISTFDTVEMNLKKMGHICNRKKIWVFK